MSEESVGEDKRRGTRKEREGEVMGRGREGLGH